MSANYRRCVLCNCTDTEAIATNEDEYKPRLRFTLTEEDEYLCSECEDEINETLGGYDEDDEILPDFN